ncbi:MAG TPA: hypothetical protein VFB79_13805 [Candidatus Angelobacter sp.]|nr:hypothetical protein [Candidatus Angelobacter sp.]
MYKNLIWLGLFALLLAAPASGQFEVSPDHFDEPVQHAPQQARHVKHTTRTVAKKQVPSGARANNKKQLAKQHKPERVIARK